MKKVKTKDKLSIRVEPFINHWMDDNIENKSKYIEYLIYQDLKSKELIKKELFIYA